MREHEHWLSIAELDLKGAQSLCRDEIFRLATFHCQQAAEKALKAYLVFKHQEIIKIHDLKKLGDLCKQLDGEFNRIKETLKELDPFATKFRYPSEFDMPDLDETTLAIRQAKSVIDFVRKKISEEMTGQMKI